MQEIQQRQAERRYTERDRDDANAVVFQELVDRREEGIADRLLLARRVEQFQKRGQHRYRHEERDQHTRSGDLAEFGYAFVMRRQERQEARGGGHGGKRQRYSSMFGRSLQRFLQVGDIVTI